MPKTNDIDHYMSRFPPKVRAILRKVRSTIRKAAPGAEERLSYRIPAFFEGGVLVYFAAFKNHIGVFPPVRGDASLKKALAKYAGPKGNLKFPFDQPIPYSLIARLVRLRRRQNKAKVAERKS